MRIFDCFLYNNEDEILELRLNILNEKVDYFVIVESKYTHTGFNKGFKFNINKFKNFSDKIIYLKCENYIYGKDLNKNAWNNENLQRNYIINGIQNIKENDYVIVSDIDEIPNLDEISEKELKYKIIIFKQRSFIYKYNYCEKISSWYGSKMCRFKHLKSPQWLRNLKVKKYRNFRIDKIFFSKTYEHNFKIIDNGGWHFSWIGDFNYIKRKIRDTAHTEINSIHLQDDENLKKKIKNLLPIKPDGMEYRIIIDYRYLPDYLVKNKIKYNHNFI